MIIFIDTITVTVTCTAVVEKPSDKILLSADFFPNMEIKL